jgi:hypothetical protein
MTCKVMRQEIVMGSNTWVRFRATSVPGGDAASNRIRLDGPIRRQLDLSTDDIVEIRAFGRVTWARVHPGGAELGESEPLEIDRATIDESWSSGTGAEPGSWIYLRAAEAVPARKVTLRVADRSTEQAVAVDGLRSLVGLTLIDGDTLHIEFLEREQAAAADVAIVGLSLVTVEMSKGRIAFAEAEVIRTDPEGPVTVQATTIIRIESPEDDEDPG